VLGDYVAVLETELAQVRDIVEALEQRRFTVDHRSRTSR
jgi:hypothetical protein